jgi:plasmid stabilization system protein ParE
LREIHDFLSVTSTDLAHQIVDEIYAAILALAVTPYIGRPNEDRTTRELILSRIRYVVTYSIRDETIEILRVRHSSRGPYVN